MLGEGPGSAILLPCGGQVTVLSETAEEDLRNGFTKYSAQWLPHCEEFRKRNGLGSDAQLLAITQKCLSPSWAALSVAKPAKTKYTWEPGQLVKPIASPEADHPFIYCWDNTGYGMKSQAEPDISRIDPSNPVLPANLCVAIGAIVFSYQKQRVRPKKSRLQSYESSGASALGPAKSFTSSIRSGASSVFSRLSRFTRNTQNTATTQRP